MHDKWSGAGETHLPPKSRPQLPGMANLGTQLALSRAQPVELENKESLQRGLVALPRYQSYDFARQPTMLCDFVGPSS